jgi:hypothetical protein
MGVKQLFSPYYGNSKRSEITQCNMNPILYCQSSILKKLFGAPARRRLALRLAAKLVMKDTDGWAKKAGGVPENDRWTCRSMSWRSGSNRRSSGARWYLEQDATKDFIPDQHEINLFFVRLSRSDREILAGMLNHQAEVGVFETLKVLEQFQVTPFEDGYEGSPFNDFIGRLADWEYPE